MAGPELRKTQDSSFFRPALARFCLPAAVIFYLTMIIVGNWPGLAAELSASVGDKFLHFGAYSILSTLIYVSVARRRGLTTLLTISALGLVDEGIQSLFPYRQADLLDLLTDILAASATVISLNIWSMAFGSLRTASKS